jgi:hypothetical protein
MLPGVAARAPFECFFASASTCAISFTLNISLTVFNQCCCCKCAPKPTICPGRDYSCTAQRAIVGFPNSLTGRAVTRSPVVQYVCVSQFLFCLCSEAIRSIRSQAPNVSLHVFQPHAPPWHSFSRWRGVCYHGSSIEPREWIAYSRTADGSRSALRLVKSSAVLLRLNERVFAEGFAENGMFLFVYLFTACCFRLMSGFYRKVMIASLVKYSRVLPDLQTGMES